MAKFFSAGLRVGMKPSPEDAYLQKMFLDQCYQRLQPHDDLYLVGNLIESLDMLKFYNQLPRCRLHIFGGAIERSIPDFENEAYARLIKHRNYMDVKMSVQLVDIGLHLTSWRIAHSSHDLSGFAVAQPSICGDGAGLWRVRQLIGGEPIINVDFDAWGGRLVTENMLHREYCKVKNHEYDQILHGSHFYDAHYQEQQKTLADIERDGSILMSTPEVQAHIRKWGFNWRRVGMLAVDEDERVICVEEPLIKDRKTGKYIEAHDIWNLPAGSAKDPLESFKALARRRFKIETGLDAEAIAFLFYQEKLDARHPYCMPVVLMRILDGSKGDYDHQAIRSTGLKTIPEMYELNAHGKIRSSFVMEALRRYQAGQIYPLDLIVTC